ncbi:MAG: IS1595 family transposase [Candidatus Tectomicrobia bacterium]|nr:IS1595 family transposase [Candidatus Tectomicrobia bacterium]
MSQKAPGKAHRNGISLVDLFRMFPDDSAAQAWFERARWGAKPWCPYCGSVNVQSGCQHKSMPYRCREKGCAKRFSVRVGTPMHRSHLSYQTWAIAVYLLTTSLKGVSSMKLHRDLKITQKSAWYLAQRIRETWASDGEPFTGPVEVDETYFGGRRKNMSNAKRRELVKVGGRGPVGKAAVVGAKDRKTKKVAAKVVERTDGPTLQGFVRKHAAPDAKVYTDEAAAYQGMAFDHETVKHSLSEYVNGDVHTNGIESLWSMLKRAHKGTFHKLSPKHLDRYVQEFAGRHNMRESDTLAQMELVVRGFEGKRLTYADLTE